LIVRLFESVLDEKMQVVPLVEDLAPHVGIQLPQPPDLAVLLGHELLVHRRDLDEQVVVGQVEVGPEELDRLAIIVVVDGELSRLVLPLDAVEIEQSRELPLALVGEIDGVCR
jgi:hypothetical protein